MACWQNKNLGKKSIARFSKPIGRRPNYYLADQRSDHRFVSFMCKLSLEFLIEDFA
jgi:hypothetical protein